ncbi:unnamed protein product [Moneuplotes crassus]|uniref:Uncharacterized protein n=1 Tax=Euplotes crassus TaxID=5936 RepID=A0AAD1X5Y2_EUPCR|nr:unnamed protein product [Moneuplotes crassus]
MSYTKGIIVLQVYLCVFMLFKTVITGLLTVLFMFHIYIKCKGTTTFNVLKKKKIVLPSKEKSVSEEEVQNKRIISDQSALPLQVPDEEDNVHRTHHIRESKIISPKDIFEGYNTSKMTERKMDPRDIRKMSSQDRISNYNNEEEKNNDRTKFDMSGVNYRLDL